jgi:hypothetical protein
MMTPQDATQGVSYLTSAATIVFLQKWLKSTEPYARFVAAFPGAGKWAHWTVAGLMSLVASVGIHAVWTGTFENGGTLTFTIPTAAQIVHGLSDFWKVYIIQHLGYAATNQPAYAPPVLKNGR